MVSTWISKCDLSNAVTQIALKIPSGCLLTLLGTVSSQKSQHLRCNIHGFMNGRHILRRCPRVDVTDMFYTTLGMYYVLSERPAVHFHTKCTLLDTKCSSFNFYANEALQPAVLTVIESLRCKEFTAMGKLLQMSKISPTCYISWKLQML